MHLLVSGTMRVRCMEWIPSMFYVGRFGIQDQELILMTMHMLHFICKAVASPSALRRTVESAGLT